MVVENQDNDKYTIKVDGSGRVTHRNRRYLRSFKPAMQTPLIPGPRPDSYLSPPQTCPHPIPTVAPPDRVVPNDRHDDRHQPEAVHNARGAPDLPLDNTEQPSPVVSRLPTSPSRPQTTTYNPTEDTTPTLPVLLPAPPPSPASEDSYTRRSTRARKPNMLYPDSDYVLSSCSTQEDPPGGHTRRSGGGPPRRRVGWR